MNILVGLPILFRIQDQACLSQCNQHFRILPELFFSVINASGMGPFHKDTTIFPVYAVSQGMIILFLNDINIFFQREILNIESVHQKPCKF